MKTWGVTGIALVLLVESSWHDQAPVGIRLSGLMAEGGKVMQQRLFRSGARTLLKIVMGSLIMAMTIATLSLMVPLAQAERGETPVFHEGQVVAITDTEVTIKEWAGTYTYRLRSGGRQELDGVGIKPGDTVIFSAWEANQIAYDFKKR